MSMVDVGIGLRPIHCVNVSFNIGTVLDLIQDVTLNCKQVSYNWVICQNVDTFIFGTLGTFAVLCEVCNWLFCEWGD